MDPLIWIAVLLRVLRAVLPWALTVGLALFVMLLAGPISAAYALPAFLFLVALVGCFLRNQVFKQERRPDERYRQYWPPRRYVSRDNRYRRPFRDRHGWRF